MVSVNNVPVFTCKSVVAALTAAAASTDPSVTIVFASERYILVHDCPQDILIHLCVDQLLPIHSLRSASLDPPPSLPHTAAPEPGYATMHEPISHDQILIMMRSLNSTRVQIEGPINCVH